MRLALADAVQVARAVPADCEALPVARVGLQCRCADKECGRDLQGIHSVRLAPSTLQHAPAALAGSGIPRPGARGAPCRQHAGSMSVA